jgi:hypothetical protein
MDYSKQIQSETPYPVFPLWVRSDIPVLNYGEFRSTSYLSMMTLGVL